MKPAPPADHGNATDTLLLTPQQAEAIVRVVEAGPHVRRRHQFFVWTQSQLQALLPHQVLACGAYQRQQRDLVFETFHSIVLPPAVLALLTDTQGPLLSALLAAWIAGRAQPRMLDLARLATTDSDTGTDAAVTLLRDSAIETLLVHGVARPQRPQEVESFFVFANAGPWTAAPTLPHLELLLPHLHTVWQRVMAAEREMAPPATLPRSAPRDAAAKGVTTRERQILLWVREGKSNHQIGAVLGISPLTVKNHVQKILRKLGASNRAQAVAEAMSLGLLEGRQG